jgi:hypothetical protein
MSAEQMLQLMTQWFGPAGIVVAGVVIIVKILWPGYEKRTQQVFAGYEARLQEYKAQLDEAKSQIKAATDERKEVTDKFLKALEDQIASSDSVQRKLIEELSCLRDAVKEVQGALSRGRG